MLGPLRTNQAPKIQDQLDSSGLTLHFVREPIPLCPCFPFWRLAKMVKKKGGVVGPLLLSKMGNMENQAIYNIAPVSGGS